MTLGANTIHPLEIEDARAAAHAASELQRGVEDRIRDTSRDLATKERAYRQALSVRIVELRAEGMAVTACESVAKGETNISDLRYARDVAKGVHDSTRQEAYRRGADRADVAALIAWSRARDLRTDAEPPQYATPIGSARAVA